MQQTIETAAADDERTIREIEQFLYREARMLDERRFHEWLELFTADVRYWMPMRSNRYPANSKAIKRLDRTAPPAEELTGDADAGLLDESKDTLTRRIARLDTGMAWAEDPPSRTRHCITNVEIAPGGAANELTVYSNFVVYRTRAERERELFVGSRRDTLRRESGGWKIAARRIVLDDTVLSVKNISIFF
ncbi:MAG TPA: 3-phenylpropionate/cinnamic acid dioxygenase subunit beta [Candidatus Elarobacter sp.]|jgi:3-phenylpropionate/cinnamic acid dioxygenase small subunit|nr:3-phenylpropionate/cinnamic acid dioxygenase subunit beta [Candidatus Elarobacter sp.]